MSTYILDRNNSMIAAGWLYHYNFPLRCPFEDIVNWLYMTADVGVDFRFSGPSFWFKDEKLYILFVLRWVS